MRIFPSKAANFAVITLKTQRLSLLGSFSPQKLAFLFVFNNIPALPFPIYKGLLFVLIIQAHKPPQVATVPPLKSSQPHAVAFHCRGYHYSIPSRICQAENAAAPFGTPGWRRHVAPRAKVKCPPEGGRYGGCALRRADTPVRPYTNALKEGPTTLP